MLLLLGGSSNVQSIIASSSKCVYSVNNSVKARGGDSLQVAVQWISLTIILLKLSLKWINDNKKKPKTIRNKSETLRLKRWAENCRLKPQCHVCCDVANACSAKWQLFITCYQCYAVTFCAVWGKDGFLSSCYWNTGWASAVLSSIPICIKGPVYI